MAINWAPVTDTHKVLLDATHGATQCAGMTMNGITQIVGIWQETEIKSDNQEAKEVEMIKIGNS